MTKHAALPLRTVPGTISIQAKGDAAELLLYGNIGDSWDVRSVDAERVVNELSGITASTINVRINSYGGSVSDGVAIYSALKRHPAQIRVSIDGIAASIASQIAMAGDTIEMPVNALMMIHAPWGGMLVEGNANHVRKASADFAATLDAFAASMAEGYAAKSGRPTSEILELVTDGNDHWMTAQEAKAAGFCDVVLYDEASAAASSNGVVRCASQPDFARMHPGIPACVQAALKSNQINSGDVRGEFTMSHESAPTLTTAQILAKKEILAAERDRVAEIKALCAISRDYPSMNIGELQERAIVEGWDCKATGQAILAKLAEGRGPLGGDACFIQETTAPRTKRDFVEAASDALAARAGIKIEKPHAGARDVAPMSISEIAKVCLKGSEREFSHTPKGVILAALTTSDFPMILENTMRKALRRGYEDEPGTHMTWIRRSTVPDFKPTSRVILGSMPDLMLVLEGGEYPHGSMDEDKSVPFKVDKYGRMIGISWEALVNDDLNALGRIPQGLGQAARRREADLVYALFEGNGQIMQDSVALFDAAHGNLAAAAGSLDADALASGRLLLRKQRAVGGGMLNLSPRILLVPPELESDAEKVIAASSIHINSGLESATPDWIRRLELVVEARLAPNAFYLLASNGQIDTAELAYIDEDNGPVVEAEFDMERDVKKFKVRAVFGARALDWRGFVKVPL